MNRLDTSSHADATLQCVARALANATRERLDDNEEEGDALETTIRPTVAEEVAGQRMVDASLTQFFAVMPGALMYRYKIPPDAGRTIHEFAAERHFVHLMDSDTGDQLVSGAIAQSLAAFCTQSKGQFVLYTAAVLCSRPDQASVIPGDDGMNDEGDDIEMSVTITGPWIKYGERETEAYPTICVNGRHDVVPIGRPHELRLRVPSRDTLVDHAGILRTRYGESKHARYAVTRALVVQPTSIERSQSAKLPTGVVVARLRIMLSSSRDEALQYARRVVYYRPVWRVDFMEREAFAPFVHIVIELDDRPLAMGVLRALDLHRVDNSGALRAAVQHFDRDVGMETVINLILSTPTLRGRVNMTLSVIGHDFADPQSPVGADQIDQLLDALLSLHPWTNITAEPRESVMAKDYNPGVGDFRQLVRLAEVLSQERLLQVVSIPYADQMVRLGTRALVQLVSHNLENTSLWSAVLHVWELYQPMLAQLRNDAFTKLSIPDHCPLCIGLQSFFSSMLMETTVPFQDVSERDHIEAVLNLHARRPAMVEIQLAGANALRLIKWPSAPFDSLLDQAQYREQNFLELLSSRSEE